MAYTVKAYALEKINLAPEDTTEEVLRTWRYPFHTEIFRSVRAGLGAGATVS